MKYLLLLPLAGLLVQGGLQAQTTPAASSASAAAPSGQIWPAIQRETTEVRQRFENAMERRHVLKAHEQALARTDRQLRAVSEARTRLHDALLWQEQLVAQDQDAARAREGEAAPREAQPPAPSAHQPLLEHLRSQESQLNQLLVQLQTQQEAQKAQLEQVRRR